MGEFHQVCCDSRGGLYLKAHMAQIHGICAPQNRVVDKLGVAKTAYVISFPRVLKEVKFLVPGFPAVSRSERRLREHFMYRHFLLKVMMFQEGASLLPQCDLCRMHMPEWWITKHHNTAYRMKK